MSESFHDSMKKKIIFVAPKTGFWEGNIVYRNINAPASLLALAAVLVDSYNVQIIDQRFSGWEKKLKKAVSEKPLFVGISFMTGPQIRFGLDILKKVKTLDPSMPTVVGGIHSRLYPLQTVEHPLIDISVYSEGEHPIIDLAKALSNKEGLLGVRGICWKDEGSVVTNSPAPDWDLNKIKTWPYYLIDAKQYEKNSKYGIVIETSRGCPYSCTYCYNSIIRRERWRSKDAVLVINEVKEYYDKYGIRNFFIIDDNFFSNLKKAKKILLGINAISSSIKLTFQGVRADSVTRMDNEIVELLSKMAGSNLNIGMESGSQSILNRIRKQTTIREYLKANRILAKNRIEAQYNFMIGFPFETKKDIKKTSRFVLKLIEENPYANITSIAIYQPYPGSEVFEYCVKNELFRPPSDLEGWSSMDWDTVSLKLSNQRKKLLKNMHVASLGLRFRRNFKIKSMPFYLKLLLRVYYFDAKLRMKWFFFSFFPERIPYDFGKKIFQSKTHVKK